MNIQTDDKQTGNILKKVLGNKKNRIIAIAVVAIGILVYLGFAIKIQIPSSPLNILQARVSVQLKKEYKNPFSKETQYVNPFQTYKNPFVVNR